MHSDYVRNENVIVGNGNGVFVSHIGSTPLNPFTTIFTLDNILCAPYIKKKTSYQFLNFVSKIIYLLNFFLMVFL
jgi:hypothetical protein